VLFAAKVPARMFASTSIDQFQTIEQEVAASDVEKSSLSDKDAGDESGVAVVALSK
jgi:MFS transporter, SP family, general alpha glucoside:H+ symporter